MPKGPKRKLPIERFLKFVRYAENGCQLWIGYRFPNGYGLFSPGGREHSVYAHRWAHQHFVGPIPEGLEVAHKCGNRACVNPQHLKAITHRENLFDTLTSTRLNSEKTHCVKGHEYTPENTIYTREGWRQCKKCKKASMLDWWRRNRKRILAERRKVYRKTHKPPPKKTHCKRGHRFNKKNTYIDSRGNRVCRECQRLAMQRFRSKKHPGAD